jgi:hypothetical protein
MYASCEGKECKENARGNGTLHMIDEEGLEYRNNNITKRVLQRHTTNYPKNNLKNEKCKIICLQIGEMKR